MFDFVKRNKCPVCGSKRFISLVDIKYENSLIKDFLVSHYKKNNPYKFIHNDKIYSLNKCKDCSLIFQKEVLNETSSIYFYNEFIDFEESLKKREEADKSYFRYLIKDASRSSLICQKVFKLKPREINTLDFGMGWGHWAIAADACGLNVFAAEISERRIDFASNKGVKVINPFEKKFNEYFHLINTDQVFEHLSEPSVTLKKLSKSLAKKGILKIFVPNRLTAELSLKLEGQKWKAKKDAFHPLEHINSFNLKSLCKLALINNLRPLKINQLPFNLLYKSKLAFKVLLDSPGWYFQKID